MQIVGALDVHRSQITTKTLDVETGEVRRGRISPAAREPLSQWLERFAGREAHFALEGTTGLAVRGRGDRAGRSRRPPRRPGRDRCQAGAQTPRQDGQGRLRPAARPARPRPAARVLDPTAADPRAPPARPPAQGARRRAHRLAAARARSALPAGHSARDQPAQAPTQRCARPRPAVAGRATSGRGRPGHARAAGRPARAARPPALRLRPAAA